MAASVQFSESNGAGETVTDGISNLNFGSADVPNLVPATHPVIRPTNSFKKYIRFHVTAMGGSTQVDSLDAYKLTGTFVTGENIFTNCPNNVSVFMLVAYATPTNGALTANVQPIASAPSGVFLGIGGSSAGALNAPGYSNYWLLQMTTSAGTPTGNVNQKQIAIQYNEF